MGIRRLYQVVWDQTDPSTAEREHRALDKAKAELNIEGYIITPQNYIDFIEEKLNVALTS